MLPRSLNQPSRSSRFSHWLFPRTQRVSGAEVGAKSSLLFERLEDRLLLDGSPLTLGTDPLIFDPTPDDTSNGDAVTIGTISYELDADKINVTVHDQPGAPSEPSPNWASRNSRPLPGSDCG